MNRWNICQYYLSLLAGVLRSSRSDALNVTWLELPARVRLSRSAKPGSPGVPPGAALRRAPSSWNLEPRTHPAGRRGSQVSL